MTEARTATDTPSLAPRTQLKVAHAYFVLGVSQQQLATIFEVNSGRIAEAVKKARDAFEIPG